MDRWMGGWMDYMRVGKLRAALSDESDDCSFE